MRSPALRLLLLAGWLLGGAAVGAQPLPLTGGAATAPPDARQWTWLYGLQGSAAPETALRLGLTTLYLPVTTSVSDLEDCRRVVATAHQAGLQVIIALPCLSAKQPADPWDPAFREDAGARLRTVVRQLQAEPGVDAWAVADYPERELQLTPTDFQAFLQTRYPSLPALNAAWGSAFPTWGDITPTTARALDAQQPFAVGRASIEVADFQADGLHRLLAFWADEVRGLDPTRPLFTGRLALYRSLVSVPDSYRYVVPEMPVEVLEADLLSQNVQAVDLARQGGAREVVPSLRLPVPPDPNYATGRTLARWLREAALHGARGAAVDGLTRLRDNPSSADVTEKLTAALRSVAGAFCVRPRCRLAILYEPYAEGLAVEKLPVYGYLAGLAPGEPSLLMQTLRLGGCYGLVDYLSRDQLVSADLGGYSAILAPTALRLPPEVQGKLRTYVERGGRFVCDLGAGLFETGAWLALPPDLARICGVTAFGALDTRAGDLNFNAPSPVFPSLIPPAHTRGFAKPRPERFTGTPNELRTWTFEGLMGFVNLAPGARPLGVITALVKQPAPAAPPGQGNAALRAAQLAEQQRSTQFAGLMAQPYGQGWALYCTTTLWARWDPSDPLFAAFHNDLWAPRARFQLDRSAGGAPVEFCPGEESVSLLNVTDRAQTALVTALSDDNRLYDGALAQVAPLPGRLVGPAALRLTWDLAAGQLLTAPCRPVAVQPLGSTALAFLNSYSAAGISLEVAGPGALVSRDLQRHRTFSAGQAVDLQVAVSDGEYRVAPGSWHTVTVDRGFGAPLVSTVAANEDGVLLLPLNVRRARIEIAPGGPPLSPADGS
ncbi:MAG TPA: hypothetical protein VGM19_11610 [Armatimonadota bacterium]